jgi:hypothetical protein
MEKRQGLGSKRILCHPNRQRTTQTPETKRVKFRTEFRAAAKDEETHRIAGEESGGQLRLRMHGVVGKEVVHTRNEQDEAARRVVEECAERLNKHAGKELRGRLVNLAVSNVRVSEVDERADLYRSQIHTSDLLPIK